MAILTRGQQIDMYTVQSLIKENLYTETYRVEDENNNPFFMKVFVTKRMPEKLINPDTGQVLEIAYCQKIKHKDIISYIGSGTIESEECKCQYYVTNYFSGELLAEKIHREGKIEAHEAMTIFRGILEGLQHLHAEGLLHNDITPRNIMLSATTNGTPEIIDLGHLSERCSGKVPFDTSDLEVLYCANETFGGLYDEQSDIFSATVVLFAMLTGQAPWNMEFSEAMKRPRKAMLLKEKRKAEPIAFDELEVDDRIKVILAKGLAVDYSDRYKSIDQILADMDSDKQPEAPKPKKENKGQDDNQQGGLSQEQESPNKVEFEIKRGGGNGFKDIAGMEELKTYLSQRVIFVIKNKEKVEKYKLTTPNGMLLYGPPGCGKTFVAEKFAEETGFNFILVKSSDLASSFVHGSQEKIAQLFKQAEKHAPIVICFDEFDALVPDRSNPAAQYSAGEVNEFLSQLNNCSQRGIFVVGTTNRPDKIDPAVLRTGRIDKQVYVPLPDKEARKEMFLLHLKGRPYDEGDIDADKLSELSDGYIASDIAYVVNDAAMVAAFTDQSITEELLETSVKNTHPSLRADTLQIYDEIKRKMENTERRNMGRPKIGFT
ncbi:AAA family ATPase [uncultured Prevotella sp.]|uniref:AAA family ATPase n=1 Tax=uncultured Prevotella sp. TaxID=159272 RepID=UPI0025DDD6AA|nr:AAA family ATPase [uncultured Prevotella sp.]